MFPSGSLKARKLASRGVTFYWRVTINGKTARIIEFPERDVLVPEGAQVGQPLVLADFQKQFILDVYDNPTARTAPC